MRGRAWSLGAHWRRTAAPMAMWLSAACRPRAAGARPTSQWHVRALGLCTMQPHVAGHQVASLLARCGPL